MGKKRGIAPKIDEEVVGFYESHFRSLNSGATWALEALPGLYLDTLEELRGKFDNEELYLIIEIGKDNQLLDEAQTTLSGRLVPFLMSQAYSKKGGKHSVLTRKLWTMPRLQIVVLELWVKGYWMQSETVSFEEWKETLMAK